MKGYVRKRGTKWSYTVDVGRDPLTGNRKQKTKSGFKTKKEAENSLNEFLYEVQKGTWIEPKNILLREFALDWMESHQHSLRDTTAEQYLVKINKWIIPLLGHYKVQDLKPIHAQTFSKNLLAEMGQGTAHKVYAITKYILNHAVSLDVISKNPFEKVSIIKDPKRKVSTWSFEELNHFLNVVKKYDEFYYRIFTVAAYTGMRKGEILGLPRMNVELKKNELSIRQSISETKKGVQICDLKTPSSYRQLAIESFLSSILKEQIQKNNEMKLKLGAKYEDHGLVFCHVDGKIFRPTGINRPFRHYIELAGVPKIRFHDLRHTHATLLLEMNVNPKIVADRLGHATVKITLDTYSHASIGIQSDVASLFVEKARKG